MKRLLPIAALCALITSSCLKSQDQSLHITDPPMSSPVFKWVKEDWYFLQNSGTITASPDSLTLLNLSPDMKYFVSVNSVRRSEGTYANDTAQIATRGGVIVFSNNPVLSSGRSMPAKLHYHINGDSIFLQTDPIPSGMSTYTFVRSK